MSTGLNFEITASDGTARRGRLRLARGVVDTPAFMPVGTYGTVKAMTPEELDGARCADRARQYLSSHAAAGSELIRSLGGLHRFMHWERPILTDSGGFQVFSLGGRTKIREDGVEFSSPLNGDRVFLTPGRSMQVQAALGSDVQMIFDDCTPWPATEADARESMERSLRWARASRDAFDAHGGGEAGHAVFGIVQGGMYAALRTASLCGLLDIGFDGMAIGGLSVGEPEPERLAVLDHTLPLMPPGICRDT